MRPARAVSYVENGGIRPATAARPRKHVFLERCDTSLYNALDEFHAALTVGRGPSAIAQDGRTALARRVRKIRTSCQTEVLRQEPRECGARRLPSICPGVIEEVFQSGRLVGAGLGCALLNMFPPTDVSYAGHRLAALPISDPLPSLTLSVGYDKSRKRRLVSHFVDHCRAYFQTGTGDRHVARLWPGFWSALDHGIIRSTRPVPSPANAQLPEPSNSRRSRSRPA